MNYPLISEYVQSIRFSEENFDKLSNLRPVLGKDGNPVMSSGNFAVVFKMKDKETGKLHAVKCFLREQEGRAESYKLIASELEYVSSTFLTPIQYLEKELFVDTTQGADTELPVLLMDWVEGITLDKYIRTNINDSYKLSLIAYQFCRMGSWLLSQEFAHGDLKPDNIIVCEDGQLVLVDYDGMFVPAMRGQKSRELGSVDYRHPLRTEDVFNGSIDDFSIASIALSLKAISLKPELLYDFGADDRLLFSASDYLNIGESKCMKAIQSLSTNSELAQILGLFYIAYAKNELSNVSFRLFNIAKPEYVPEVALSTKVTDEDWENCIRDEYGVFYSRDGFRLLYAPDDIERYKIKDGTNVICNLAFDYRSSLQELVIPSSVTSIGYAAFNNCSSSLQLSIKSSKFELIDNSIIVDILKKEVISCLNNKNNIIIPSFVTSIGERAFERCSSLQELTIPSSVTSIGKRAFFGCSSLRELAIPSSVTSIDERAFFGCSSLRELAIPSSVTSIGERAFRKCSSLQELVIPSSVTSIGEYAFFDCSSLRELVIPSSVTSIGYAAFNNCSSSLQLSIKSSKFELIDNSIIVDILKKEVISCLNNKNNIIIPSSVTSIGERAFERCSSLQELAIPSSVTSIGKYAFWGCSSLQDLVVPPSVTSIGDCAFSGCSLLRELTIPSSVTSIGEYAFEGCSSLQELTIPSSVTSIGEYAFRGCSSLRELVIPSSVTSIGYAAFNNCSSLQELVIPSSVTSIEERAFSGCSSLRSIMVPKGQVIRFRKLLRTSSCDLSIVKEQD